jgi:hypothetical protein
MSLNLFGRKPSINKQHASPASMSTGKITPPGKTPPKTSVLESLESMRETVKNVEKRQDYLQKRANTHMNEARRLKATDKHAAMMELKRAKLISAEVDRLSNVHTQLETQILSIESANVTVGVFHTMQMGASTQKALQKNMDVETVHMLHQEMAGLVDAVDEVNQTLGTPLGDLVDEDALARELEALDGNVASHLAPEPEDGAWSAEAASDISLPKVPTMAPLPKAPTTAPVLASKASSSRDEDDEELARLAKEMEV